MFLMLQGVYVQVNNRILEGGLAIIYMIKLQPNKKLTSNQPAINLPASHAIFSFHETYLAGSFHTVICLLTRFAK